MSPHCGNLAPHPAHEWIGHTAADVTGPSAPQVVVLSCSGVIRIEGGSMCRCGEQPAARFGLCRWCLAEACGGERIA